MVLNCNSYATGHANRQHQTTLVSIGVATVILNATPERGMRSFNAIQSWRTEASGRWIGFS